MGVVVLDAHELGLLLERPLRRQILGVEVVRHHLGRHAEHREIQLEIGPEGAERELRVEIAEVRGEERLAVARDAEGALQLRSRGDDRLGSRDRQRQCPGGEAPGAAHRKRRADDGVLAAAMNRPVVCEEDIGDLAQPFARFAVLERDRLVRAVAARQHERSAEVGEQQVVERGVGEHQAEPGHAGRDRARHRRVLAAADEHDRALARVEQRQLLGSQLGKPLRLGRHQREGLLLALLARAQRRDHLLVRGVAGEVVAAEPLDGDDGSAQ